MRNRWLGSAFAIVSTLFFVHSSFVWRNGQKGSDLEEHRQLESSTMVFDDDQVHFDSTCRQYLDNFLNDTTDLRDQCEALVNALTQAGCNSDLRTSANTTDDVVITDDLENRYCCRGISKSYGKHCETQSDFAAEQLLGIVSVLVICGLAKSALKPWPWIPEAVACIAVGSIVGGVLRLLEHDFVHDNTFDNDLFLQVLLPPIIFEAALSINKRAFWKHLFPILTFAIVGTGICAVAIGFITHTTSQWFGDGLPLLDSLLFGALMSSIDPVAVLGILSSVGVKQDDALYILIFGESLLNDGVSIVLFDSLVRHMGDADVVDQATIRDTLGNFIYVIVGSLLVGMLCGACASLYFWWLQGQQHDVTEVALFFCWALIPYYIADGLGNSGIIAIMIMGFMMDYFVIGGFVEPEPEWGEYRDTSNNLRRPNEWRRAFDGKGLVLEGSRRHVGFVAQVMGSLMETAIFAYLGIFLFNQQTWSFLLTASGVFACVGSRLVMILVVAQLINACVYLNIGRLVLPATSRREYYADDDDKLFISPQMQLILFGSGIRGAVSYALVQNIPVYDSVTKVGSHYKAQLKSMTSATIVTLLIALGALVYHQVQGRAQQQQSLTDRLISGDNDDLQLQEAHHQQHQQQVILQPQPMMGSPQQHSQMMNMSMEPMMQSESTETHHQFAVQPMTPKRISSA